MSFVGRYNVCKSCLHDWLDNEFAETVSGGPEIGATLNIVANGFGCDLGYCDYDDLLGQTQTFPGEVMDNG